MNYLTNHYKQLSEQLQKRVIELQEKLSLLEETKKAEKPLAEPSTKEGSDAKRVPLNIKTQKTDPKEEKEKVEKEDMVMKEESSVGYTLESSIRAILEGKGKKKKHGKKERDYNTVRAKDRRNQIDKEKVKDAADDYREEDDWEVQDGPQPH